MVKKDVRTILYPNLTWHLLATAEASESCAGAMEADMSICPVETQTLCSDLRNSYDKMYSLRWQTSQILSRIQRAVFASKRSILCETRHLDNQLRLWYWATIAREKWNFLHTFHEDHQLDVIGEWWYNSLIEYLFQDCHYRRTNSDQFGNPCSSPSFQSPRFRVINAARIFFSHSDDEMIAMFRQTHIDSCASCCDELEERKRAKIE